MIQAEGRALRRIPEVHHRAAAIKYLVEARAAAQVRFPTARWSFRGQSKGGIFQMPCPSCGRWVHRWCVGQRWWVCMQCAGLDHSSQLLWAVADYLCGTRLGLTDKPMRVLKRKILRRMNAPTFGIMAMIGYGIASGVLLEKRDVTRRFPSMRLPWVAPSYGPLRDRLSVCHADAVWDMQVCPEAYWSRVVVQNGG